MSLRDVFEALHRRWLLVIAIVLAAVMSGAGTAIVTPSSYVSSATILLRWIGPGAEHALSENSRYMTRRAQTYALLVERPSVLNQSIKASNLDLEARAFANRVEAEAPLDSQTIIVRVRSTVPEESMLLANSTARALVQEISQEEDGVQYSKGKMDAVVAVVASTPSFPDTPRLLMYLAVGTLIGSVIATLTAIVLMRFFTRDRPRRRMIPMPSDAPALRFGLGHLTWAALVAATLPWRTNVFYDGGADPVVLAKAGLSFFALILSFSAGIRTQHHYPVPAVPLLILTTYFLTTLVGAMANNDLASSLVVTTRAVMLMTTVTILVASYGARQAMRSLIHVFAAIAFLGTITGLVSFDGRLRGVIPPLNPNTLAFISAVIGIWLLAKVMAGQNRYWELFATVGCLIIVLLTGSRSALAAMGVAAFLMSSRITALRNSTLIAMAVGLPAVTYLSIGTDLLSSIVLRGGTEQVTTLSNRTIAWRAAFTMERDGWQTWFGQGLAQKKIPVPGQWWDTQLLDSSWISAFVQGGIFGSTLAILLSAFAVLFATFSRRRTGATWMGLAIFTTLSGILESGLFDGSLLFMVLLVTALGAFGALSQPVAEGSPSPLVEPSAPKAFLA
ncbi:MAG: O-antigen ligase family protein [Arachnia sp.]